MWMDIEDICGLSLSIRFLFGGQLLILIANRVVWVWLHPLWSLRFRANQWVAFSWPQWLAQARTCDINWLNQCESQYCCGRKGWVFFSCRISPERRWAWHCCSHGACGAQRGQGLPHGDDSPEKLGLRGMERNPHPRALFGPDSSSSWRKSLTEFNSHLSR